ncbi:MAG: InlB B-repeat-containing protein, partial [Oscillospiraceae bacterium]|nr:InlB B-repeat-containing protein [Oscillospiraceae bacterium]
MKKRALSLFLALCMAMALLPAPGFAAPFREDTSLQYDSYRNDLGKVYDLSDSTDTLQVLDYEIPKDGATVLFFFEANNYRSDDIFDNLNQADWAQVDGLDIIAVESSQADKATTQKYVQEHNPNGAVDKVYYNPDSMAPAYWYYTVWQDWSKLDQMKTIDDLKRLDDSRDSKMNFVFELTITETDGKKDIHYGSSGTGGLAGHIHTYLRVLTNLPVDGEQPGVTITFDANGGTTDTPSLGTKSDGCLARLPTPERSGYAFYGWWTAPAGGARVTLDTMFDKDSTLYARWYEGSSDGSIYKKSGDLTKPKLSEEEVIALVRGTPNSLPEQIFDVQPSFPTGWSGEKPYAAGKLSSAALQVALDRLNAYRTLAGVPTVTLDQDLCDTAQHGAVLMASKGSVSHTPTKPENMSDEFFALAKTAAQKGNLEYGAPLNEMVDDLMYDSDSMNRSALGHRRWQLNPAMGKTGFGCAIADLTSMPNGINLGYLPYTVEMAQDRSGSGCEYDFISWPSSGNFPDEWFETSAAWSVTLNPDLYQAPARSQVSVTLTRESDQKVWKFFAGNSSGGYFNVNNTGYGVNNCIIFIPTGLDKLSGTYTVDISGLKDAAGSSTTLSYQVNFIQVPQTHTITFDANGGTCGTASAVANASGRLDNLPTPVHESYSFAGWWTASVGGERVTEATEFKRNTTVYAHWSRVKTPALTFESYSNGTVKPPELCVAGLPTTVYAYPDEGYEVESVTAADASGKQITVTKSRYVANAYSFTMPDTDVSVKVVFRPINAKPDEPDKPSGNTPQFTDVPAWFTTEVGWAAA